ncbi:MAG: helix-turn-helix transcriptional regulator [Gemmataceae bacterium]
MSDKILDENLSLVNKISQLVQEQGWTQEEFAQRASLNRQTVRKILKDKPTKLHNKTVSAVAKALNLDVRDLRLQSVDKLLVKMKAQEQATPPTLNGSGPVPTSTSLRELATDQRLLAWIDRNPERAGDLLPDEIDEILSLEESGVFVTQGVEMFVQNIERRRRLIEKIQDIASTEHFEHLEAIIELMHKDINPYRDRL